MQTITQTLDDAVNLHREGQYAQAEVIYRQLLAQHPNHPEVTHLLGLVALQTERIEEALHLIQKAIALNPQEAGFHHSLGMVCQNRGQLNDALACFQKAVQMNPNLPGAWNSMALTFQRQGKLKEAIECFQNVVKLTPDRSDTFNNLGVMYQQLGDLNLAIQHYRQCLVIDPRFAEAHSNLGFAYQLVGMLDYAIASCQEALRLRPTYAEAFNNLGLAYHRKGFAQEAINNFEQSLTLKPDNANAHFNLGNVLKEQAQYEKALTHYQAVLRLVPGFSAEAYFSMGHALQELNRYEEAIVTYQQALKMRPNLSEAYNNMGSAFQKLGRLDDAVLSYQKALECRPDFLMVFNNLAAVYKMQGRVQETTSVLRKALTVDPRDALTHNNLGLVLKEQFLVGEAIECFLKALECKPDYYEAQKNLADAYLDAGQTMLAIEHYEKTQAMRPREGIKILMAGAQPRIYKSKEDVMFWRNRFMEEVAKLQKMDLQISDPLAEVAATNFYLAYHGLGNKEAQQAISQIYCRLPRQTSVAFPNNPKPKIGFISNYFLKRHVMEKLNYGVINKLSRDKFDVVFITIAAHEKSPIEGTHTHINLNPGNLSEAIRVVGEQKLDILFYADIGMDPLTLYMAFHRLAPVQCVTWGHPDTTGIDTLDYFISSHLLEVEHAQEHYSEKLVLLNSLPTYYYPPQLDPKPVTREQFGLTADDHLYLCPQNLIKFHPDFDPLLGEILRRDPKGKLVMINPYFQEWNPILLERFQNTIPDVMDRIVLLGRMSWNDFVSLQALADVMLDTLHFGGGNTTYEALALGTPIVTLPTEYMRSRVTSACYKKMGVTDCIANSPEEYIDLAVRIGSDRSVRDAIKSKILAANIRLYEDMTTVHELEDFFMEAIAKVKSAS